MNRLVLSGEIVAPPERKQFAGGSVLAIFTVRVERPARDGETSKADEIRAEAWGAAAEVVLSLPVGARVVIDGAVRASTWTAPSGEPRSRMYVHALAVEPVMSAGAAPSVDVVPAAMPVDSLECPF